jgi:hypothetical protein
MEGSKSSGEFWREFLRVEFDKMLLFALSLYLWHIGQPDYAKAAMYGLAVAINHNRFQRSPSTEPQNGTPLQTK